MALAEISPRPHFPKAERELDLTSKGIRANPGPGAYHENVIELSSMTKASPRGASEAYKNVLFTQKGTVSSSMGTGARFPKVKKEDPPKESIGGRTELPRFNKDGVEIQRVRNTTTSERLSWLTNHTFMSHQYLEYNHRRPGPGDHHLSSTVVAMNSPVVGSFPRAGRSSLADATADPSPGPGHYEAYNFHEYRSPKKSQLSPQQKRRLKKYGSDLPNVLRKSAPGMLEPRLSRGQSAGSAKTSSSRDGGLRSNVDVLIKDDSIKKLWSTWSWGANTYGQLGILSDEYVGCPSYIELLKNKRFVRMDCGRGHTALLTDMGHVYVFGNGANGELGNGEFSNQRMPKQVLSLQGVVTKKICSGGYHTVIASSTHEVFAWGLNDNGQCGAGHDKVVSKPSLVKLPSNIIVTAISAGYSHSLAVTNEGHVYTWGSNDDGQLGHGDFKRRLSPYRVEALAKKSKRIVVAGCSWKTTVVATADGEYFSFGLGNVGQLGTGNNGKVNTPDDIMMPEPHVVYRPHMICGGAEHFVLLTKDGMVYTWGGGMYGQLGHNNAGRAQQFPRQVDALKNTRIVRVACGEYHSMLMDDQNSLLVMGRGKGFRLGNSNKNENYLEPKPMEFFGKSDVFVTCFAGGGSHSLCNTFSIEKPK